MNNKKFALVLSLGIVTFLAIAMIAFYQFQQRTAVSENDLDASVASAPEDVGVKNETSEYVGVYTPTDGPMEGGGKRISFFTVNRREEGGYLGSAKVDTVGAEETAYFNCVDVRIDTNEFFLNCLHETEGTISLSGKWSKDAAGTGNVSGKVLWVKDAVSVLEVERHFQQLPLP